MLPEVHRLLVHADALTDSLRVPSLQAMADLERSRLALQRAGGAGAVIGSPALASMLEDACIWAITVGLEEDAQARAALDALAAVVAAIRARLAARRHPARRARLPYKD